MISCDGELCVIASAVPSKHLPDCPSLIFPSLVPCTYLSANGCAHYCTIHIDTCLLGELKTLVLPFTGLILPLSLTSAPSPFPVPYHTAGIFDHCNAGQRHSFSGLDLEVWEKLQHGTGNIVIPTIQEWNSRQALKLFSQLNPSFVCLPLLGDPLHISVVLLPA